MSILKNLLIREINPHAEDEILLVDFVEQWFRNEKMPFILYNKAHTHHALIALFEKKGFSISLSENEMVQLKKNLNL